MDVAGSIAGGMSRSEAKVMAIDSGRVEPTELRETATRRKTLEVMSPRYVIDVIGLPP